MMAITTFDSEGFCGYTQITTFFEDFGIADHFGVDAIKDTYKRGLETAKSDYKMLTEFVMVLNWKSWEHANGIMADTDICQLYVDLFYKAKDFAIDYLEKDDEKLSYFLRTID